jgi:ADP-ribose pyrophosphatase
MQEREVVLVGSRFNVERRWVSRSDGGTEPREVVVHPGAVVILPLLDDGRIVLIRNHRFSVERTLWELPAGTRDPNEPVLACAARELEEETGYRAATLTPLLEFYTAPGVSDERMYAFVASGLTRTQQHLDATEQIEVFPLPADEVLGMLQRGEIEDAKSIATLLFLSLYAAVNLTADPVRG